MNPIYETFWLFKRQYFREKIMKNLQCRSLPISHLVAAPDQSNLMPSGVAGLHWENAHSCQLWEAVYRDNGLHHFSKAEVCRVATESLNAHLDSPEGPATRRKKTHIPKEFSRKIQSTLWYQKEMGDTLRR